MNNNDNKWNNFIHSPLLIAVVVSALIVTVYSASQKDGLYSYYKYDYSTPFLTLFMKGIADGATPFYVSEDFERMSLEHDSDYYLDIARQNGMNDDQTPDRSIVSSDGASLENDVSDEGGADSSIAESSAASSNSSKDSAAATGSSNSSSLGSSESKDSSASKDSTAGASLDASKDSSKDSSEKEADESLEGASTDAPVVEEFPFMTTTGTVDADYFADALFIGDSRTVGLSEYCQELDEQATFYGKVSLSIYEANNKAFVKTGSGKLTLEKALEGKEFKKVYIMVGINEIGYGSTEGWISNYSEVISKIQAACPDAIIYLQAIMHVTKQYDDTKAPDASINGVINTRSQALSALADNRRVFYLDLNEVFDDENGNLQEDISFDGVHLKASAYTMWYEYLKTHVAVIP